MSNSESGKWRVVLRLRPGNMPLVDEMVRLAGQIDPLVQWRITTAVGGTLIAEQEHT